MNYTKESLAQSKKSLKRLHKAISHANDTDSEVYDSRLSIAFKEAMDDDFNTSAAISALFDASRRLHKTTYADQKQVIANTIRHLGQKIGLFLDAQEEACETYDNEVLSLIAERDIARKEKNWARSDEIRDVLLEKGVNLSDKKQ